MKKYKIFIGLFFFLFSANTLLAQIPECVVNPPLTDDMFVVGDGCWKGDVIFSYADFQALSDNGADNVFGVPYSNIGNSDFSATSNDNAIDLLAGTLGGMSLSDIYNCLEIGCSPHLDSAGYQLDLITDLITNTELTQYDIDTSFAGEGVTPTEFENELGVSASDLQGALSEALNGLDLDEIIAEAFGVAQLPNCDNGPWLGLLDDTGNLMPELPGGEKTNSELKAALKQMVETMLMGNEDFEGDPNWFLGDIEGLGAASAGSMMPSPSATSTISSVQAGVDLYNGKGTFQLPLDNISAKDVGTSIAVNTTPGGLHVDDMEGLLGSNMSVSSGGKVTRVVNGLPDEFNGTIKSHAYGNKRGLAFVTELADVTIGIDAPIQNTLVKKILCKLIKILLKEILHLDTSDDLCSNMAGDIEGQLGELEELIELIEDPFELEEALNVLEDLQQQLANSNTGLVNFITKGKDLVSESIGNNVTFTLNWKPIAFNYLNAILDINIPLTGSISLVISINIRAGLKTVDVPSDVHVYKRAIGYSHLLDASIMSEDEFGLDNLDVNEFQSLSMEEKLEYLNKTTTTKKRSDKEFFSPNSYNYLDMFAELANLLPGLSAEYVPEYHTAQIDLEPDEYYYEFGGYSGKFYIQPKGEIVLVPYQDFVIHVEERPDDGVYEFRFITPEGVEYTFNQVATSRFVNYTLPDYFKYREDGISRKNFLPPTIGEVQYPSYLPIMGIPVKMEVKKDFLTNYHIEEAPEYTSAWHLSTIESKITKERIDFTYKDQTIHYNAQKNWTQAFPNFSAVHNSDLSVDKFITEHNHDLNAHFVSTEWKNGFGEMVYSMSEVHVHEPIIDNINNNRGKVARFTYQDNPSMPGGSMLSRIDIEKNDNFYKGWEFGYTTPDYVEVEITCNNEVTTSAEGQGAAYATDAEYSQTVDVDLEDMTEKFIFSFPLNIQIFCIRFGIPIDLKFNMSANEQSNYYFLKTTSELGSLLHLKDLVDLPAFVKGGEDERFQAEFIRNFLFEIREIDTDEGQHVIAAIDYNGDMSTLPKRYSIHQDIWGYYNGLSDTYSPFIKQTYTPISGGETVYNSDHFAYSNASGSNISNGRNWEADLSQATIGQIDEITLETGGFFKYDYDLHEYPEAPASVNPLNISSGGLRILSLSKGSSNGPTMVTNYEYIDPTVVNFPVFLDQHEVDEYYKDIEQRVRASWKPLNQWQMNKGGYVGYGQVNEVYSENGRIEHYFTNPTMSGYEPVTPDIRDLFVQYKRIVKVGPMLADILTEEALNYHPTFAPLIAREWRLGLERESRVYDEAGTMLQQSLSEFTFTPMEGGDGILHYPATKMFQYMHYGSVNDWQKEAVMYQLVDAGTACPDNLIETIIYYFFKLIFTEHPYRYIEKDYVHADMIIESEKIELKSNLNTNFYSDGSSNSTNTEYAYRPLSQDVERKLESVTTSYSSGQSTSTEYEYAEDQLDLVFDFLEGDILTDLDLEHNYEVPIHQVERLNGVINGGSLVDFQFINDRYLAESIWGYREGTFSLTGVFDSYDSSTGMPTSYKLAKYGTDIIIGNYEFYPSIDMTWNNNLQEVTRTTTEGDISFTTTNNYDNSTCLLSSSTDINGLTTAYDYDNRHRLIEVVSPEGLKTVTTDYQMNPLIITSTTSYNDDTPNQGTIQTFDGWGNPLSTERFPLNATLSSTSYDNFFRPVAQSILGNGSVEMIYEPSPLSRVVQSTDAVGNITTIEYLGPQIPAALLDKFPENSGYSIFAGTSIVDANGHTSYNWEDAFKKGSVWISGEENVTISTFDSRERIVEIVNPIGEKYEYSYNPNTGNIATKEVPGKGPEKYWFDKSLRMVAKTDAKGNTLVLDFDDIYRLTTIKLAQGADFGSVEAEPLDEGVVNGVAGDLLLENVFVEGKSWKEQVTEGVLRNGGVDGTMVKDFTFDGVGRIEQVVTTYNTDLTNSIHEIFTPISAAGISENVQKIVMGPDGENILDYQFTFDEILRSTHTQLDLNNTGLVMLEELIYNNQDQLEIRNIGGTTNGFMQEVNYSYDAAGRLIAINDPITSGCIQELEVCQLYWGSAEKMENFDEEFCGGLVSLTLDGETYELPVPLAASNVSEIETFINEKIKEQGLVGMCEVHYQNILGMVEFHISIMKTNVNEAILQFEGGECTILLDTKECCEIIAMGQDGEFPLPNTPSNPDLFFEGITYNGLDISLIETVGSCTAGLSRNHYRYDADHRLLEVKNELYNPEKINGALSTSYTYDPAGNIKTLNRNGWVQEHEKFMPIDELLYTYASENSSQLMYIMDEETDEFAQPNGFNGVEGFAEYSYDVNGNLLTDSGKELSVSSYNLLNLPEDISVNGGNINHEYTFTGEKILKEANGEKRHYLKGLEYAGDKLELIDIPSGRILLEEGTPRYQYNIADHLGNVVVVFEDVNTDGAELGVIRLEEETNGLNDEVLQRNHYYSFGMRVDAPGLINNGDVKNKYLYNGKEIADDFGLDWHYYGFRMYDAAIARFPSVDPAAEQFAFVSPYNYAENEPISNVDLYGLQAVPFKFQNNLRNGRYPILKPPGGGLTLGTNEGVFVGRINGYLQVKQKSKGGKVVNDHFKFDGLQDNKIYWLFDDNYYKAWSMSYWYKQINQIDDSSTKKMKQSILGTIAYQLYARGYNRNNGGNLIISHSINSFRHQAWMAISVILYGEQFSKDVADRHERKSTDWLAPKSEDHIVDLLNNAWGREAGKDLEAAGFTKESLGDPAKLADFLNRIAKKMSVDIPEMKYVKFTENQRPVKKLARKIRRSQ